MPKARKRTAKVKQNCTEDALLEAANAAGQAEQKTEKPTSSALEELFEAYDTGIMAEPEKLANLITGAYHELTDGYRPFVQAALPRFVESLGADLGIIIGALIELQTRVVNSQEYIDAMGGLTAARARVRSEMMDCYIDRNFTNEQAFELVKLDVMQYTMGAANMFSHLSSFSTTRKS